MLISYNPYSAGIFLFSNLITYRLVIMLKQREIKNYFHNKMDNFLRSHLDDITYISTELNRKLINSEDYRNEGCMYSRYIELKENAKLMNITYLMANDILGNDNDPYFNEISYMINSGKKAIKMKLMNSPNFNSQNYNI